MTAMLHVAVQLLSEKVHNINKVNKKSNILVLENDFSIGYFKNAWIILVVVQRDYLIAPRRLYKWLCWQLYSHSFL